MYKTRKSRRYFYYWKDGFGTYTTLAVRSKRTKCLKKKSNHKVRTYPFTGNGGYYRRIWDYMWTIL